MAIDLTYYVNKFNGEHSNIDSRGKAFDCLHKAFIDAIKSDKPDCGYLALQLYAFLGSWGMLHYKAFLMQRNYKILINVIKELVEKANDTKFNYLVEFVPEEKHRATYKNDILYLAEVIKSTLHNDYGKEIRINVTDTLIGKILLGTFGCMPAFDSNFRKTAAIVFDKKSITIENSIDKVLNFALENKSTLISLQNGYPIMKIVDMAFWAKGEAL